ncbi:hypothetical protein Tco_1474877 [Tanacetum coccineum]
MAFHIFNMAFRTSSNWVDVKDYRYLFPVRMIRKAFQASRPFRLMKSCENCLLSHDMCLVDFGDNRWDELTVRSWCQCILDSGFSCENRKFGVITRDLKGVPGEWLINVMVLNES